MTAQLPKKGTGGVIFSAILGVSLVLLFIGERIVLESGGLRLTLALLALAGVATALGGRLVRRKQLGPDARAVERKILLCYAVTAVALVLYFMQADFVMDRLRPHFAEARSADRYAGALAALWPTVLLCALFPLLFIEISYAGMDVQKTIERGRIRRSAGSGLLLAMTICLLFLLNFIANEFNKKTDLSYFKTTRASEPSRKMVQHLSEPLKVTLFYPGANEVQEQVVPYFEDLKGESKHFQLKVVDHAMEPELAKELGVTDNGTVVISRGKQNQQIRVGTTIAAAKSMLKKLDSEFQNAFMKLSKTQKIAYFTTGHEERSTEDRDKKRGTGIRDLHTILRQLNYSIKDLGIGQGLGSEVPTDATVVIIAGPQKDFLPAEIGALRKYLEGGGRVMAFLDPEAGLDFSGLLAPYGLKLVNTRLANDKFYVRVTHTQADRHYLFSNRFSAHPSVSTLSRNSNQLATVMLGAGALEEIPPTGGGEKPQVQFTLHAMPFSWNDLNANTVFDAPDEARKSFELAAVVTRKVSRAGAKPQAGPQPKAEAPEMRLMVVADSDVITDQIFRNPGNGYLFVDTLKWMGGEEEYIGETSSEEDVRIMHTRKEDQIWFYLTIFGMPALVLTGGLVYTRRRRRKP